jgi:hypothetical protein
MIEYKGRGHTGIIEKGASQLWIKLREQLPDVNRMPYVQVRRHAFDKLGNELRIGRFGRRIDTQQHEPATRNKIMEIWDVEYEKARNKRLKDTSQSALHRKNKGATMRRVVRKQRTHAP